METNYLLRTEIKVEPRYVPLGDLKRSIVGKKISNLDRTLLNVKVRSRRMSLGAYDDSWFYGNLDYLDWDFYVDTYEDSTSQ